MKPFLFILIVPWTTMLRGLVLVKLWTWFVVPYFHAPDLRIPVALGISTLIGLFTLAAPTPKQAEDYDWAYGFVYSILGSLFALGCGAIYRCFL